MKRVHIVGRKNHGKTTLILQLVAELTRRGLRVGTIKHTSHIHELDTPETDSHRHRQAGAAPAAIITGNLIAVYIPKRGESDDYKSLEPLFAGCDLVLVEGDCGGAGTKLEVWREAAGGRCLASEGSNVAAVLSDDRPEVNVPVWPRSDVATVANRILSIV
ncbi:MAG: molybdopterin-guanine dinucleotide biosynthesis protein B [Thermoguttaceae bacterium]